MNILAVIQSMRLPFLAVTPVCIFLGASTVTANQTILNPVLLLMVLTGALLAHISVNLLNEYFDFKSGLDLKTTKTPFSGGSGALPNHPDAANSVLAVGITALAMTTLIGLFLILNYKPGIAPIGVLGILLVITYSGWINKQPLLCLVAPGTGFGLLMVIGTQYVMEGRYTHLSLLISAIPFFLVNNLLLLNQYPDIQADAGAGRKTFPIVYGINNSNLVYTIFTTAVCVLILIYVTLNIIPPLSLMALAPMPLAYYSLSGAIRHGENVGHFPKYLAANVVVTLLVPLLLGLSIIIG